MGPMRRVLAAVACCSVHALHFPIAYGSRLSLPSLPVKQLCIDCKKPEDDPRAWRDEIRRRAAQCGCGYREGNVVFASDPSPDDLAVLCGNDGTAQEAYCSYDVGSTACAYCDDPAPCATWRHTP